MLTPRPDKYRGARCYVNFAANPATFPMSVYRPPASGALVSKVYSDTTTGLYSITTYDMVTAAGLTQGLGVISSIARPIWGPDYQITGVLESGQSAAAFIEGWQLAAIPQPFITMQFELYPPNVLVIAQSGANIVAKHAFEVREFPSAEELMRWPSSRA